MHHRIRLITLLSTMLLSCHNTTLANQDSDQATSNKTDDLNAIRIATFNVSLYGKKAGEIRQRLSGTDDIHAKRIASIVQTIRPDVLLVNELDYEPDSAPARLLAENYFGVAQESDGNGKLKAIQYPYWFSAPSNTGIDSQLDLNKDGKLGEGSDAWGFGVYPGQYAMTVYSRFPIDEASIRTFQQLLWSRMPGALRVVDPKTESPYYDDTVWPKLRLSSKNHIDVPIRVGEKVLHVLASHPTPPVFDGPEDRNGARNHDEVQFWNHYLDNRDEAKEWLVDDKGSAGGLDSQASFVIMGDLNADPIDGSGRREAITRLITHDRVNDVQPMATKTDAADRVARHNGAGNVQSKTSDFGRNGLMRVDFALPSQTLDVVDSGVFWPGKSDPRTRWVNTTDHRMVWIEINP